MRRHASPGRGSTKGREGKALRRIVIALDDETFWQVRAVAVKRGCSFAEVARELIDFGLLDLEGEAA